MSQALVSAGDYQAFIYALPERYPSIERSTLVYITGTILFLIQMIQPWHPHTLITSTFRRISSITVFQRQI